MKIGALVDLELDTPGLTLLDRLRRILCHRSGFRIRHQPAGSKHFAELTHLGHGIRRGHRHVEIRPAVRHLLDQIGKTHRRSSGGLGSLRRRPLGKYDHADRLAGSMRQAHRATNHLVALLWVHAKVEGQIHARIALAFSGGHFFEKRDGLADRIAFFGFDQLGTLAVPATR